MRRISAGHPSAFRIENHELQSWDNRLREKENALNDREARLKEREAADLIVQRDRSSCSTSTMGFDTSTCPLGHPGIRVYGPIHLHPREIAACSLGWYELLHILHPQLRLNSTYRGATYRRRSRRPTISIRLLRLRTLPYTTVAARRLCLWKHCLGSMNDVSNRQQSEMAEVGDANTFAHRFVSDSTYLGERHLVL